MRVKPKNEAMVGVELLHVGEDVKVEVLGKLVKDPMVLEGWEVAAAGEGRIASKRWGVPAPTRVRPSAG
jgi:hypothetical protein